MILQQGKIYPYDGDLKKEYTFSFEMRLTAPVRGWTNILRLTNTDDNFGKMGDRIIWMGLEGPQNIIFNSENITHFWFDIILNEWYNVKISQTKQDRRSHKYTLKINDQVIQQLTYNYAGEYDNVKLFTHFSH